MLLTSFRERNHQGPRSILTFGGFSRNVATFSSDHAWGGRKSMRGPGRSRWVWLGPLAIAALGCAGAPEPVEACLKITPSENLHTYNGQPHVLPIYVYSLSSSLAF